MDVSLRAYPIPYLAVELDARYFQLSSNYASLLTKWLEDNKEEVHRKRIRDAEQRVLSSLAFANAYDLIDQFKIKQPKDFRWDSYHDYEVGNHKIKLINVTISERWGNTGPNTVVRLSKRTLERSKADVFVACAFSIPTVSFLGWFDREGLMASPGKWSVEPLASSSKIHPMWELEYLEKKRSKGYYV
jgi:hypothetical protein